MNDWNGLKAECASCVKCGLCEQRHNVVFGVGNENADVMFVGGHDRPCTRSERQRKYMPTAFSYHAKIAKKVYL